MTISQAMATSFKVELLNGIHAFSTTVVRAATTADTSSDQAVNKTRRSV